MSENTELIGRIATRREDHDRHLAAVNRSETRAAAKLTFRARLDVAASVGLEWGDVRHWLIVAAVHDLYQALLITEGTSAS